MNEQGRGAPSSPTALFLTTAKGQAAVDLFIAAHSEPAGTESEVAA